MSFIFLQRLPFLLLRLYFLLLFLSFLLLFLYFLHFQLILFTLSFIPLEALLPQYFPQ